MTDAEVTERVAAASFMWALGVDDASIAWDLPRFVDRCITARDELREMALAAETAWRLAGTAEGSQMDAAFRAAVGLVFPGVRFVSSPIADDDQVFVDQAVDRELAKRLRSKPAPWENQNPERPTVPHEVWCERLRRRIEREAEEG